MALEGRGLAWLPQSLVREELGARRLQVAGPVHWRLPVEIRLYRDPQPLSGHAEAFWRAASAG
jgi:DNA-binding transcriptional LysR family regulator